MILTSEHDLDSVKVNQNANYLGQISFLANRQSRCTLRISCSTRTTKLVGEYDEWCTDQWWIDCYIMYSKEEFGRRSHLTTLYQTQQLTTHQRSAYSSFTLSVIWHKYFRHLNKQFHLRYTGRQVLCCWPSAVCLRSE